MRRFGALSRVAGCRIDFGGLCVDVGLLNEAVMHVWGWRAGCPAASWASLCCGGLIESAEEAHFRVIYCHPNTSCLLCCCPASSWGVGFLPLPKLSEPPPLSLNTYDIFIFMYMYVYIHIVYLYMYISTYMCVYVLIHTHRHTHTYFFWFVFNKGPRAEARAGGKAV